MTAEVDLWPLYTCEHTSAPAHVFPCSKHFTWSYKGAWFLLRTFIVISHIFLRLQAEDQSFSGYCLFGCLPFSYWRAFWFQRTSTFFSQLPEPFNFYFHCQAVLQQMNSNSNNLLFALSLAIWLKIFFLVFLDKVIYLFYKFGFSQNLRILNMSLSQLKVKVCIRWTLTLLKYQQGWGDRK